MHEPCKACKLSAVCMSRGFDKAFSEAFYAAAKRRGLGPSEVEKVMGAPGTIRQGYNDAYIETVRDRPQLCPHVDPSLHVPRVTYDAGFGVWCPEFTYWGRRDGKPYL